MTTATKTYKHAIRVARSESGTYEIIGDREPWEPIAEQAESVEVWGDLMGWGQWKHSVRVESDTVGGWYFVR